MCAKEGATALRDLQTQAAQLVEEAREMATAGVQARDVQLEESRFVELVICRAFRAFEAELFASAGQFNYAGETINFNRARPGQPIGETPDRLDRVK